MEDKHPPEKGEPTPEKREVKGATEARGGKVFKGAPMWWVLVISTVTAALALLIIFLVFGRTA